MEEKILENYSVEANFVKGNVTIKRTKDFVPIYELKLPEVKKGTLSILEKIRTVLVTEIPVKTSELIDISALEKVKRKYIERGLQLLRKELPIVNEKIQKFLVGLLINEMFGLGKIELLLEDPNLEEIVVNGSKEPVWVYHKKYGWLKTNIYIPSENEILNYANSIGRKAGRQITILSPLMDAHLETGAE